MQQQQSIVLSEVEPQNRENSVQKQVTIITGQAMIFPSNVSLSQYKQAIFQSVLWKESQSQQTKAPTSKEKLDKLSSFYPSNIYFQRQPAYTSQCLKHSINNYYGFQKYTTESLVQICKKLSNSWINPHKHIFGGDYDVNVLFACLEQNNKKYKWHDKRIQFQGKKILQQKIIEGFFINTSSQGNSSIKKWLGFSARHWLSMKIIKDSIVKFDTSQDHFQILGINQAERQLNQYLQKNDQVIEIYK